MSISKLAMILVGCTTVLLAAPPQTPRQNRVVLSKLHADAMTPAAGNQLVSGVSAPYTLPKGNGLGYANGTLGFQVVVPDSSTTLKIQLVTATPGADVDLYVRFGQDVDISSTGYPLDSPDPNLLCRPLFGFCAAD